MSAETPIDTVVSITPNYYKKTCGRIVPVLNVPNREDVSFVSWSARSDKPDTKPVNLAELLGRVDFFDKRSVTIEDVVNSDILAIALCDNPQYADLETVLCIVTGNLDQNGNPSISFISADSQKMTDEIASRVEDNFISQAGMPKNIKDYDEKNDCHDIRIFGYTVGMKPNGNPYSYPEEKLSRK